MPAARPHSTRPAPGTIGPNPKQLQVEIVSDARPSILLVVMLTGKARVEAADQTYQAITFSDAEIKARTLKTARANGVVVSLLQDLEVGVAGIDMGGLARAAGVLLTLLGPVLDGVIHPVLDTLGLRLGEGDVTVVGADCPDLHKGRASLVG